MSNGFVPFFPAGALEEPLPAFQPRVLANALHARPAVLTEKPDSSHPGPGHEPRHAGRCEPKLELQRDGDRITAIRVTCGCGQVLELACVY